MAGQEYDRDLLLEFYRNMFEDIAKQRKRIGGDWAIAHVIFGKDVKDLMRFLLHSVKCIYKLIF